MKTATRRLLLTTPALIGAAALSLSGCAKPPAPAGQSSSSAAPSSGTSASGASSDFKACMVSDTAGFNDKSFNQTSLKGLTDAASAYGIQTDKIQSSSASDYAKNLSSMVSAGCNMVVSVGFLLADDTLAAAKANPKVKFAIVDDNDPKFAGTKNLKPLVFNTAQSSFLGGYLAAAMTKTGKVGTFGGAKIPTVTIYMDGFAQGVEYYNKTKGKNVQVLGWDSAKQDGQFVPGDNPFENTSGGQQTAQALTSQGADVIFPVAGGAGVGALQVAKASGGKVNAIWVDADGCQTQPNYCSSIITSVFKGMDVSVKDAIGDALQNKFTSTAFVGTLQNGGTGLTGFHDFDSKVPGDVKTELDQLKSDIESGKITITSKSQPSS
ncbi:basic membrane protein A [Friedmanniella endophytica]|uniref:Basic membrane protein A n=1 Tax=Microlunatus kandeliicorticis TaxID=1759536 RepID=A0A7W3IQC1_9ACTN|nr:BMP family ABC transporter substrate-binding protein [Microlunatus kandeliicorticis]MBA8793269.1 basic membrane protein A [Microlunatus kandeliicorticis]